LKIPRHRDTLLLAAGTLQREMIQPAGQSRQRQHVTRIER
jgi:hypothetical protein